MAERANPQQYDTAPLGTIPVVLASLLFACSHSPQATDKAFEQAIAASIAEAKVKYASENLLPTDVAATVWELDSQGHIIARADVQGNLPMYPASVVKAFFMAYLARCVDNGSIKLTAEVERAARNMIVDSNNDATGHIVDVVTGAYPGPELGDQELRAWMDRRQTVNRWFRSMGYSGVNACQRTYNEGPYGRERQGLGPNYEYRNMLTTNACARLMVDIVHGRLAGKEQTEWMKGLLRRSIPADSKDADSQSRGYIGSVLGSGCQLMSKAGWTSEVRHDIAYVLTPTGRRISIAIFTKRGRNLELLQFLAKGILSKVGVPVANEAKSEASIGAGIP